MPWVIAMWRWVRPWRGATVKGYAELDRRISRIAIAADISRDKAKELKDEINAVSNTKGIRIDPNRSNLGYRGDPDQDR